MTYSPRTLTQAIRQRLLDAGITPVTIGVTAEAPNQLVGLSLYEITADTQNGQIISGLQVLIRGTTTSGSGDLTDVQEQIFGLLTTLTAASALGGQTVVTAWRQMSPPEGLDGLGRPFYRDTYYLRTDRLGFGG